MAPFIYRACSWERHQAVYMCARSAMITKNRVLCALHTAWSISWSVVHRSYYSTTNHSVCLRTVMDALILSLRTECLTLWGFRLFFNKYVPSKKVVLQLAAYRLPSQHGQLKVAKAVSAIVLPFAPSLKMLCTEKLCLRVTVLK